MDAIDRFAEALVDAGHRRRYRWTLRGFSHARLGYTRRPVNALARLPIVFVTLVLALATTAIALAAAGVILTGAPVRPAARPVPTVGDGAPVAGGTRLLPLRVPDPAGGLPWGMRIVHTTRGLICVQIGRIDRGQLGQLGIDGAFGDDGRFHALPADALPDVVRNSYIDGLGVWSFENCTEPGSTYAGDVVGLQSSGAGNPHAGVGATADRREISFGLLGAHAVSIAYRAGSQTHIQPVLPGLGAYLIVQRYTSGRPLGSVSETDGSDQPYPYSDPASPNGALTAITYRYAGRLCTDTGRGRALRSCGLSEGPPPHVAPLPGVRVPLRVHLQVRGHTITGAEISFRAPYAVTDAGQDYSASARTCRGVVGAGLSDRDVQRGATVSMPVESLLASACASHVTVQVEYVRFAGDNLVSTAVGTVTIREPPGTHAVPLPRRLSPRRGNP